MRHLLTIAAIAAGVIAASAPASALTTITATLTADNHYGLYTGAADGSGLTFVGRNEPGFGGNPGSYNWSQAETWINISATPGNYLYVVAWNDGPFGSPGNPQMWIGSFLSSNGKTVVSNAASWTYKIGPTVNFPGDPANAGALLPSNATLASVIGNATPFSAVLAQAPNGTGPWGTIAGVDPGADFIWHDSLQVPSASDGSFVIYREVGAFTQGVPELSTWAMMIIGFAGVGLQLRRRNPVSLTA